MSKLLFIGGFPSGGTDLTRSILNAHPEIYINGEMPFLYYLPKYGYDHNSEFRTFQEIKQFRALVEKLDEWNNLENINFDFAKKTNNTLPIKIDRLFQLWFSNKKVKIWGNKTPQNTENVQNLLKIFPKAYFLIVLRDVRDVCLSCKRKWGKSYLLTSHRWATRMKSIQKINKSFSNNRILYIKFEDLLTQSEQVTKRITDFLGIEWSSKMLEHNKYVDRIVDGKINYGEKIKSDNMNKWRQELSYRIVRDIESIAFDTMILFDYEPMYAKRAKNLNGILKMFGYLSEIFAMILIGNRFSKKNSLRNRMKYILFEVKKRIFKSKYWSGMTAYAKFLFHPK
jgi:hypothetical protein